MLSRPIAHGGGRLFLPLVILAAILALAGTSRALTTYTAFTAEGSAAGDSLGRSVAPAGDVNRDGKPDFVIGAPGAGTGTNGQAYIYLDGWASEPAFVLNGSSNEALGFSVASAGDFNGDGYGDVIVGAPDGDVGGTDRGAAYIYFGCACKDTLARLTLLGTVNNAHFGYAVAGIGDVNGDGYDDVAVGAPDTASTSNRGHVRIFFGGAVPDAVSDVAFIGEAYGDRYGHALAGAGDVNGDGYDDFLVGLPGNDAGGPNAGRAYLHYGAPSASLIGSGEVTAFTGAVQNGGLGMSVAGAGDVNGDGRPDIIVGDPGSPSDVPVAGRAQIYLGGAGMDSQADLTLVGAKPLDKFGSSVASAGDVDGDGYGDVIVGAVNGGTGEGNAQVFFGGSTLNATADVTLAADRTGEHFGISVASAGDLYGDGHSDVLIGDHGADIGATANAGRARIYDFSMYVLLAPNSETVWTPGLDRVLWLGRDLADLELSTDGGATYSMVRRATGGSLINTALVIVPSVSTEEARVRVVASGRNATAGNSATSDLFTIRRPLDLVPVAGRPARTFSAGALPDSFGFAIATLDFNGDGFEDVLIGEPGCDSAGTDAGRAHLYVSDGDETSKKEPIHLVKNGEAAGDAFGFSVANAGDVNGDGYEDALIGAPRADSSGKANCGKAYLLLGNSSAAVWDFEWYVGAAAGDQFGFSVAGNFDFNDDRFKDIAIGSPFSSDTGGYGVGRVDIVLGSISALDTVTGRITLNGHAPGEHFGWSVAGGGVISFQPWDEPSALRSTPRTGVGQISFSSDPEGRPSWLAVGAPQNDSCGIDAGAVYVFHGGVGSGDDPDFALFGEQAGEGFGQALVAVPDLNGDLYSDLAVGAPGWDAASGSDAGRVMAYALVANPCPEKRFPSTFPPSSELCEPIIVPCCQTVETYAAGWPPNCPGPQDVLESETAGDRLGTSLGAGDLNADGLAEIVVGLPGYDAPGQADAGAIEVIWGRKFPDCPEPGGRHRFPDIVAVGSAAGSQLGRAVGVMSTAGYYGEVGYIDLDKPHPMIGADVLVGYEDPVGAGVVLHDLNRFHLVSPRGGESWSVGSLQTISWMGDAEAKVELSLDGGISYQDLCDVPARTPAPARAARDAGLASSISNVRSISIRVPHTPTRFAKLRIRVPGCNQVPCPDPVPIGYTESDSFFTIQSSVALLAFSAARGSDGVTLTWSTNPGVAPDGIAGFRLYRLASGTRGEGTRIGPDLITETRYLDRDGAPGDGYRLAAVNGLAEEFEIGRLALDEEIVGLKAWPSPLTSGGSLNVAFAAPMVAPGVSATDLDVGVFDVSGRRVATLARGYVKPEAGAVRLTWPQASHRPGVYFVRAVAPSAGFRHERRVVVVR